MAITQINGDFDVNSLEGSGLKHSASEEFIRDEVIKDVLLNGLRADPSTCNEAQLRFVVQQKNYKEKSVESYQKRAFKMDSQKHARDKKGRYRIDSPGPRVGPRRLA